MRSNFSQLSTDYHKLIIKKIIMINVILFCIFFTGGVKERGKEWGQQG